MPNRIHRIYKPGQKLKLYLSDSAKTEMPGRGQKTLRICTVVRQYPAVVQMTYMLTETDEMTISLTPWEIEKYQTK